MSDDIKKGLLGIVVDETEVSKVMPEINSLTYRGYAAQDLCEYCRFEEVAYLILNKDLPNTIQLRKFEKEEKNVGTSPAKGCGPFIEPNGAIRRVLILCGHRHWVRTYPLIVK